jgi:hypothetical protein
LVKHQLSGVKCYGENKFPLSLQIQKTLLLDKIPTDGEIINLRNAKKRIFLERDNIDFDPKKLYVLEIAK